MKQVESQGSPLNGGSNLLFRKTVCFKSSHFRSASYTSKTVFSLFFHDTNWNVKINPADFLEKLEHLIISCLYRATGIWSSSYSWETETVLRERVHMLWIHVREGTAFYVWRQRRDEEKKRRNAVTLAMSLDSNLGSLPLTNV